MRRLSLIHIFRGEQEHLFGALLLVIVLRYYGAGALSPGSYTHLDVYKRQALFQRGVEGCVEDGQSVLQEPGVVRYRHRLLLSEQAGQRPLLCTAG